MRILIADDHAIVRRGLVSVLNEEFPRAEIAEAGDSDTLFKMALGGRWDLIISDVSMPGRGALEIISEIKRHFPDIPILALSIHPEEIYGIRALRAGASAFLNKDAPPAELKKAINLILQARKYITPRLAEKLAGDLAKDPGLQGHDMLSDRELEVMKLIASGESLLNIGEILSISPSTVSSYRSRILKKMQMQSNSELTRYCIQHGLS
ncbi:MAG TPA: response regulator transcription factor [Puia sp.]|uniref:response regulator transcription factor n=1 Tax=Puia sp. TaxID=2045100 RepID=UPI002CEDAE96|nr:response regulator transcription factor [Puia sp.]HVU94406.1 response regulator transcription factor [Puia sp.]